MKPARDGACVSVQRKRTSGAWTTIRLVILADAGSARSTYSTRLRLTTAATYRTRLAATPGYLTGTSRERSATAR